MARNKRELLAGYVDGELSDEEKKAFEEQLARDPALREELAEFRKLQEVTGMVKYADLPDEVWDNYWHNLYRKTERGIGWILVSLGAILLLCFGTYELFSNLYADPKAPLWFKVALTAGAVGFIFLLVSYGRERLFAYNRDRYKEVQK
jgi:hypothetical protein